VPVAEIPAVGLLPRVWQLNAEYARALDDDRLEEWPDFFSEDCLYKVTSADNHRRSLPAGLIYADSKDAVRDRVAALRKANIYERQRYRHIVGLPQVIDETDGEAGVETPFLVVRIMRTGAMDLFATGRYLDRIPLDGDERLRFRERVVVCDGGRFDTLVALPL
jgi:anthranilate 1,2-dioxygenase small subunit/terephthalate 1,2-dioxygenase oxygenase component beta subunit